MIAQNLKPTRPIVQWRARALLSIFAVVFSASRKITPPERVTTLIFAPVSTLGLPHRSTYGISPPSQVITSSSLVASTLSFYFLEYDLLTSPQPCCMLLTFVLELGG